MKDLWISSAEPAALLAFCGQYQNVLGPHDRDGVSYACLRVEEEQDVQFPPNVTSCDAETGQAVLGRWA